MSENVHECYTVSLSRYPLHLFIYYSTFTQEDLDNKYVIRKKEGEAWKPLFLST